MSRRPVDEVRCDRCKATEHVEADPVLSKGQVEKLSALDARVDKHRFHFEDLCSRCRKVVFSFLEKFSKYSKKTRRKKSDVQTAESPVQESTPPKNSTQETKSPPTPAPSPATPLRAPRG